MKKIGKMGEAYRFPYNPNNICEKVNELIDAHNELYMHKATNEPLGVEAPSSPSEPTEHFGVPCEAYHQSPYNELIDAHNASLKSFGPCDKVQYSDKDCTDCGWNHATGILSLPTYEEVLAENASLRASIERALDEANRYLGDHTSLEYISEILTAALEKKQ